MPVLAGYYAIDSLRMEKGYRVWGADIGPEVDPYSAGLGFCVKLDKGEFIGRQAVQKARKQIALGSEYALFRKLFRREMHQTVVSNMQKVGLLNERTSAFMREMGINTTLADAA